MGSDSDLSEKKAKELVQSQFGREASKYVTSQVHSSQSDLDFILEFIQPEKYWKCLDIATGTGHLALTIAPHTESVIASDITPEMLDQVRLKTSQNNIENIETAMVDVHEIPYSSNSFDFVASRIAPHHFYDIDKAVKEMVRVLKRGGKLFIQDTIAPEDPIVAKIFNRVEKLRDPSHVRDLSVREWVELFELHQCKVLQQTTKPKHWPLRWWTERMSTPGENVETILGILEEVYPEYADVIHLVRDEPYPTPGKDKIDSWSIYPHNGYFLGEKS